MAKLYNDKLKQTNGSEHAFAPIVRILGKGKTGSRSLDREEARSAMAMILSGETTDVQLGAFLMLLRVKEESEQELAGFVEATRDYIKAPEDIAVDLDWSSYAGKKRQLPWFLLSCFLLADNGVRIYMHGASGHTPGRLYTESVLNFFNIPLAEDWSQARQQLQQQHFAFMPLSALCPPLQHIIELREQLGLRSPVHTLARLINPLAAAHSMQSVFHPAYASTHQGAAQLLGQANAVVFKGEGGEIERKPEATCTVRAIVDGRATEEHWDKLLQGRQPIAPHLDMQAMADLWSGTTSNNYGEMAVLGTTAITLKMLGKANTQTAAMALAQQLWQQRNIRRFD